MPWSVIVPCIGDESGIEASLLVRQMYEVILEHSLVIITKNVSPPVVIAAPAEVFAVTITVTGVKAATFWMPVPLTTEKVGLAVGKNRFRCSSLSRITKIESEVSLSRSFTIKLLSFKSKLDHKMEIVTCMPLTRLK